MWFWTMNIMPNTEQHMGICEYKLTDAIPENIKILLPSVEELEHDLNEKIEKAVNPSKKDQD